MTSEERDREESQEAAREEDRRPGGERAQDEPPDTPEGDAEESEGEGEPGAAGFIEE